MVSHICLLVELGPICNSMAASLCLKSCEDHSLLKIYSGGLWKNNYRSGPFRRDCANLTRLVQTCQRAFVVYGKWWSSTTDMSSWTKSCLCDKYWPRGYKTWVQSQTQNKAQLLATCWHVSASSQSLRFILVQSQTQNKAQWLAACGHVSASSQSLRIILSLRMNSRFITSRPDFF